MLRLWPVGGHPWENSQEETWHRSGGRKAELGLFHSSGPFWTQRLPAGIGPAGSKERLEMPAWLRANGHRRAGSPPGPQTPRDQAAGPGAERQRVERADVVYGATTGPVHRFEARSRPFLGPRPRRAHGSRLPSRSGSGSIPALCNWFQEPRAP